MVVYVNMPIATSPFLPNSGQIQPIAVINAESLPATSARRIKASKRNWAEDVATELATTSFPPPSKRAQCIVMPSAKVQKRSRSDQTGSRPTGQSENVLSDIAKTFS